MEFSELTEIFFDISNLFAVQQLAAGNSHFQPQVPRPTDGLLLFVNTVGICYQQGQEPLYVPQGSLVYLPQGSYYVWENSPVHENELQENLLVEFTLHRVPVERSRDVKKALTRGKPDGKRLVFGNRVEILSTGHAVLHEKLFRALIGAFHAPHFSPLAVYEAAYELFYTLAANQKMEQANPVDNSILQTGLRYLTEDRLEPRRIEEIADSCNVSVGHFERLFRNYAGMSPGQYRTLHRINRIKMMLQDQNMSLTQICEKIGYCDCGYLCRMFKKKTGMTPNAYRKMYWSQVCTVSEIIQKN